MSRRPRQVGDLLREELSDIVRTEMSDPRVGFFTITRVDVSSDLRTAVAMVSVLGSDDERSETVAALRSASGFIRRHLKPRLRMRQIPDLIFEDDRSMEHAQLIASALAEIEKEHPSDRAGPEPQE